MTYILIWIYAQNRIHGSLTLEGILSTLTSTEYSNSNQSAAPATDSLMDQEGQGKRSADIRIAEPPSRDMPHFD
ncbi:uncharacterized protein N7506_009897 [Penicillium brevicompactum]|uniref:uncharacterized protein n=1 Tax=Penicillium brevicompactum TaxID=5074 RepID=UPI0025412882|nr:uncharacterized protein N7506_009897 [Penicillium brevicompactum]KAJ5326795.1 hypothetical protein N7506_009897 [Penicillium brevicompactum]